MNDLVAVLVIVVIFILVIIFLSSLALNSFTKVSKDEMRMMRNMNRNMNRNTKKSVLYPIVDPNAYWWPTNWNIPQVGPTHHNQIHPAPVPGHESKHNGRHHTGLGVPY